MGHFATTTMLLHMSSTFYVLTCIQAVGCRVWAGDAVSRAGGGGVPVEGPAAGLGVGVAAVGAPIIGEKVGAGAVSGHRCRDMRGQLKVPCLGCAQEPQFGKLFF